MCRMIRNGPLKISNSLKKAENGPLGKISSQSLRTWLVSGSNLPTPSNSAENIITYVTPKFSNETHQSTKQAGFKSTFLLLLSWIHWPFTEVHFITLQHTQKFMMCIKSINNLFSWRTSIDPIQIKSNRFIKFKHIFKSPLYQWKCTFWLIPQKLNEIPTPKYYLNLFKRQVLTFTCTAIHNKRLVKVEKWLFGVFIPS